MSNVNARFGRQPLPPQKQQKPETKEAAETSAKSLPNNGGGTPVVDPNYQPPFKYVKSFEGNEFENNQTFDYKPENLQAYFIPHTVCLGGSNNVYNVKTGAANDHLLLNPGDNCTANIQLNGGNDNAWTNLNMLLTTNSGNNYTIDGGPGNDKLLLGMLSADMDFSVITSKQLPDGSWELTIPPSNGGTPNTITLKNIESVYWMSTQANPTPPGSSGISEHNLSLSEFLALTTIVQ